MYSLEQYAALIQHCLDQGYRFLSFSGLAASPGAEPLPWLLLRHDIDLAPVHAVRVARVNQELGVVGTFFFQLDAMQYNLLDRINRPYVREILECDQRIGLHFSAPESEAGLATFLDEITFAFEVLQRIAGTCDEIVAWHNPSVSGVSVLQEMNRLVRGLFLCTYNPPFAGPGVTYLSDSLMRRTPDQLLQSLDPETAPRVQLCLHPAYWVLDGREVTEVFLKSLHTRILHLAEEHELLPAWRAISPAFRQLIAPLSRGKTSKE